MSHSASASDYMQHQQLIYSDTCRQVCVGLYTDDRQFDTAGCVLKRAGVSPNDHLRGWKQNNQLTPIGRESDDGAQCYQQAAIAVGCKPHVPCTSAVGCCQHQTADCCCLYGICRRSLCSGEIF